RAFTVETRTKRVQQSRDLRVGDDVGTDERSVQLGPGGAAVGALLDAGLAKWKRRAINNPRRNRVEGEVHAAGNGRAQRPRQGEGRPRSCAVGGYGGLVARPGVKHVGMKRIDGNRVDEPARREAPTRIRPSLAAIHALENAALRLGA